MLKLTIWNDKKKGPEVKNNFKSPKKYLVHIVKSMQWKADTVLSQHI